MKEEVNILPDEATDSPPLATSESVGEENESTPEATGAENGRKHGKPRSFHIPCAVVPQPVPEDADLHDPSLYFNRELGWLDFNWRVLHLAMDERTPLLERVRFIAITASNLDEFIQKRVGGLKRQEAAGVRALSPDGRTPTEQLQFLREAILVMHQTMTTTWKDTLKPLLSEKADIHVCHYRELKQWQQDALYQYFRAQIYPILTPLAVDPGHPFPFISNLSLSLAVLMRHPEKGSSHFARLKVPISLGRWLSVPLHPEQSPTFRFVHDSMSSYHFVPVEQVIAHHIGDLFPGMEILNVHAFRVTRNADIRRDDEEAEDLLSMISEELRERRFAPVARIELEKSMPGYERDLLLQDLDLSADDVYEVDGLLDLTACFELADLDIPQLKYEPWNPVTPKRLQREVDVTNRRSFFNIIRDGDLLVHHPYDSFQSSVQALIEEAAQDEKVLAIKQTLYRTSDESPVVKALIRAAERGKQVAVLVEVKARFDEANNIEWGQMLQESGVHVAYGLVGLKTHTKATLIVRKEEMGIRTYCHIGTGNYHPKTARLYTDLGLFTARAELGQDVVNLFHYLTGYAPKQPYNKVLVAPQHMRTVFYNLIQQEVMNQKSYGNGHIIAKMNALDDVKVIRKLYKASRAGVQIDLIVRGHSRLRPGLPGFSENIRVISILGRFLEHDRIFYFHNNEQPLTFIGSADWRGRNLNDRVELITPIEEPKLQQRLIQILQDALDDNRLAWELHADGRYLLRRPAEGEAERNFHKVLMKAAKKRAR